MYSIYRPTGIQLICAHGPLPWSYQLCDRLSVIRLDLDDNDVTAIASVHCCGELYILLIQITC